jgi:hypothetical protein
MTEEERIVVLEREIRRRDKGLRKQAHKIKTLECKLDLAETLIKRFKGSKPLFTLAEGATMVKDLEDYEYRKYSRNTKR